ncbi:hypothetical protein FS749_006133 [Ceratobasidium sp. UAMH 11750]|nr:hypothetical protein FS749_006133 [Ceratobasidium sp. UAMH 11750]
MTSAAHPRWGPPLKEYLDYPEASLVFPELVGETDISTAIDAVLYTPATVNYKTLETVMAVIYRPAMIGLFKNGRSIRPCMHILEMYANRNGSKNASLLEHAFGFLGLHVLSLVLQAGLIDSFGGLDRLPRVLARNTNYPWEIQAPALHDKYVQKFLDYFTSDLGFGLRSHSSWQIEWCKGTRGDDRACLPAIGGFTFRDAEFVLRQLFERRDVFLECGFRTKALGWSILLYVIQCLLDDRWWGKPNVPELWKKQYHIAYRYALISGARADVFMELVCGRFMAQYHEHFAGYPDSVDLNDVEHIQLAYDRKFRPNQKGTHKSLDLSYLIVITDYTRDHVVGHPSPEVRLVETTLEITWDVLLCMGKAWTDERWAVIDVFMRKNFGWKAHILGRKNRPELVTKTVMLLHKLDIISMFGRYLLILPYLRNNMPHLLNTTSKSFD